MASDASWNPDLWLAAGGEVPNGWRLVPFAELLETPKSISVGVMYPGENTFDGVPLIRIGDVTDNGAIRRPSMRVSAAVHNEYRRTELAGNELLITLVGNPGLCIVAQPEMKGWNVARALAVARLKIPDLRAYVKALMESGPMRSIVTSMLNTTVQPTLNLKEIKNLPIPLPEKIEDALDIGAFASMFNDRIDNLRQTNATLEAIAQSLFKAWFVDFDGVPPEDMQESELGSIPKGWRVGSVYDIADVRYGAPFASSKFNTKGDGLPLVRIRDLREERPSVFTPEVHPKGYLIQPGDIIVGMDGEFRAYLWGGEPAWLNQRICAFHPKPPHCATFVHNAIAPDLARVEATEVATTVIHLGKGDIDQFRVVIPSDEAAAKFETLCQPLYDKIVTGKQQAATLANLRDALLPRLISGQLRVKQ